MKLRSLSLVLCCTITACQTAFPDSTVAANAPTVKTSSRITPTTAYRSESIAGFTVLFNPEVLKHPRESKALRKELQSQLLAITRVVPNKPLAKLKKVRIWVEWQKRANGAAEFHPSADWLRQNGYNPDKAGDVELSNTRNFVQWSQRDQPWMVLHELAHAYHYLVLGDQNADIQAAYQNAIDRQLYKSVAYVQGGKKPAYALTNNKEYFAETSEAYFGKNDFYPFNRADLKQYDPMGYQLMEKTWKR
ncbi:hypothetical protein [Alkalinema sp. FACHB-956]|uniref:hypothetical protein n=1 Tax=Alkalinema sp. FACHB-956 TaxID=2692768 RepID=UPI001688A5B6|nr:hypothetical protein [Alkalinema sp. FACHB-956]MBD2326272.1 hypothetical protein [Alkalinema sp. FACHB-956]